MGLVYSASSSGPPAAEGYFAGGRFTLLAVLVLLQRRVTLPRWDPLTGRRASLAALALSSNTKDALSSSILLTGKPYHESFFYLKTISMQTLRLRKFNL